MIKRSDKTQHSRTKLLDIHKIIQIYRCIFDLLFLITQCKAPTALVGFALNIDQNFNVVSTILATDYQIYKISQTLPEVYFKLCGILYLKKPPHIQRPLLQHIKLNLLTPAVCITPSTRNNGTQIKRKITILLPKI